MRDTTATLGAWWQARWRRLYPALPILPPAFFCMILGYEACNWINGELGGERWLALAVATPWDAQIPFLPGSLPLYLSFILFYYLPKALLRAPARNEVHYRAVHQALQWTTLVSCAVFLLAPTEVELRAQALPLLAQQPMPEWLRAGCLGLFAIDGPYNAWPSLHVSQPLLIMLAVTQLQLFTPLLRRLLWLHWLLVTLSVLTMKQHYLWDVVSAVMLGGGCWALWLAPRLKAPPLLPAASPAWGRS